METVGRIGKQASRRDSTHQRLANTGRVILVLFVMVLLAMVLAPHCQHDGIPLRKEEADLVRALIGRTFVLVALTGVAVRSVVVAPIQVPVARVLRH